jgi:hypothetical protein
VKSINARATLISLLMGLAAVTPGQADQYYVYQTPNGGLVITNKEPPPGSKVIKQFGWTDATETDVPQSQSPNTSQPNGQQDGSPKPSKNK